MFRSMAPSTPVGTGRSMGGLYIPGYLGGRSHPDIAVPDPRVDPEQAGPPLNLTVINATIGASGQTHNFAHDRSFHLTYYNSDTVNTMTITVWDVQGGQYPFVIAPGASNIVKKCRGNRIVITGNSATVYSFVASWPGEYEPGALVALSNSVTVVGLSRSVVVNDDVLLITDTAVYTCPAGKTATILRGNLIPGFISNGAATVWIQSASGTISDYITPKAGVAVNLGTNVSIGGGPGNDIVIADVQPLGAGDSIVGSSTGGGVYLSVDVLQEPL